MAFGPKPADGLKNVKLDFDKAKANSKPKAKAPLERFKPGELITVERLNAIIDAINDHEARLGKLEVPAKRGTA